MICSECYEGFHTQCVGCDCDCNYEQEWIDSTLEDIDDYDPSDEYDVFEN